jgi:hypothetical protein
MIRKNGHRFSDEITLKQKTGYGGLRRFKVQSGHLASSHRTAARAAPHLQPVAESLKKICLTRRT